MIRLTLPLLALLCLAACGSTGGSRGSSYVGSSEPPVSVTFRDYRSKLVLTLVNDGLLVAKGIEGATPDLRRAAFYSKRDAVNLGTKVASDELMRELVRALEGEGGFTRYCSPGRAPRTGLSTSVEIEAGASVRHWAFRNGMSTEEQRNYRDCRDAVIGVHSATEQYQSASPEDFKFGQTGVRR